MEMMPPSSSVSRGPSHKISRLVIGSSLIMALGVIIGMLLLFKHWHVGNKLTQNKPLNATFIVTASTPPSPAARLIKGGKLTSITIPEQGTATMYDAVTTSAASYYLLSGPGLGQATFYRKIGNSKAGLEQLSTSTSMKLELAVNETMHTAVYTAYDSASHASSIILVDLVSRAEQNLGLGQHPVLLADGVHVLAVSKNALVSIDRRDGSVKKLIDLPVDALFAVNTEKSEVAVYKPQGKIVQLYSIDGQVTKLTAGTVLPVPLAPIELLYSNHSLIIGYPEHDALRLVAADGGAQMTVSAPGVPFSNLRVAEYVK